MIRKFPTAEQQRKMKAKRNFRLVAERIGSRLAFGGALWVFSGS